MTIKCPKCGHEQVFVVEFDCELGKMKQGKTFWNPILLEDDGFEFWWIGAMTCYDTENEVAQCGMCGHKDGLNEFGFGVD